MSKAKKAARRAERAAAGSDLLDRYGCGRIRFSGTDDGLYERHLLFDDAIDPAAAGPQARFTAVARSVRDVLSQRWVRTASTYDRENPKQINYLSMEFLIGRSLTNNIINLLLEPFVERAVAQRALDWLGVIEQEHDAGLGNGGLGRLAACFIDSMATRRSPRSATGGVTNTACSTRRSERLADRRAGQLAAPPGPVGGRASRRAGGR